MRALLFVLLIVLAGCSGSGGGSLIGLTPGGYGGTITVTAITPTPSPSPTPGGPPPPGIFQPPIFRIGGTGTCQTTVAFTGLGQSAIVPIIQPTYAGGYTATSSSPAIVSAGVIGSQLSIAALAAGAATVTVTDAFSQQIFCNVTVTTSAGTIQ